MCLVSIEQYKKGINMKLFNISNVNRFFQIVDSCSGNVFITSKEGDRFNLKSNLSKYVIFTGVLSEASIHELELEVEKEEDKEKFISFMMDGE